MTESVSDAVSGGGTSGSGGSSDSGTGGASSPPSTEPRIVVTFQILDAGGRISYSEHMTWDESSAPLLFRPFTVQAQERMLFGQDQRIRIWTNGTVEAKGLNASVPVSLEVKTEVTAASGYVRYPTWRDKAFPATGGPFSALTEVAFRDEDLSCGKGIGVKVSALATGRTPAGAVVKADKDGHFRLQATCPAAGSSAPVVTLSVLPGTSLTETGTKARASTLRGAFV